jgi:hypothetical protein
MLNTTKLAFGVIKRPRRNDEAEVVWEICDFGNNGVLMLAS